jgi:5-methylcytosine-specific restriction enzyme subunit McrC
MLLRLAGNSNDSDPDDEPIATFDSTKGLWWAGRYVGEVQFQGLTLRIEPRFGMPIFMRWLTTIWGVRLVESHGGYQQQHIWLWLVIAHLWAGRLIAAGKHGLPSRRVDTIHHGRALRGRLLARNTALLRSAGSDSLASLTRARVVDTNIGGILLAALDQLRAALGHRGQPCYWLPDRGQTLVEELVKALGEHRQPSKRDPSPVRYSPITESYRPVVDLSLSILAHRPLATSAEGRQKAFGILLDMAEIWELYVAKLLQIGLPGWRISHTGRSKEHFHWLLRSSADGDKFGSLRPDIIISDHHNRPLAIVDAKYKTTRVNAIKRSGIATEDLYQLAAYLSAFGDPAMRMDGFLVYPSDEIGQVTQRLSPRNPWTLSAAPRRNLWFISTQCEGHADAKTLTDAEGAMTSLVHATLLEINQGKSAIAGDRHASIA